MGTHVLRPLPYTRGSAHATVRALYMKHDDKEETVTRTEIGSHRAQNICGSFDHAGCRLER
jgi:hypothetical protein